jgi:hypothetical protein
VTISNSNSDCHWQAVTQAFVTANLFKEITKHRNSICLELIKQLYRVICQIIYLHCFLSTLQLWKVNGSILILQMRNWRLQVLKWVSNAMSTENMKWYMTRRNISFKKFAYAMLQLFELERFCFRKGICCTSLFSSRSMCIWSVNATIS